MDKSALNGLFDLDSAFVDQLLSAEDPDIQRQPILNLDDSAFLLRGVLSDAEVTELCAIMDRQQWTPVGIDGQRATGQADPDVIGSWRATAYDPAFARAIWNRS